MFEALKSFVAELTHEDATARDLDADGYRLAAAALLVHAARIDGEFSANERSKLRDLLKQRFDLDDAGASALIEQAAAAEKDAVDLYHFTSVLKDRLDDSGRCRIVEMLWQIAYADGELSPFEDNLIWRVADLLGVDSRERIALRQRVAVSAPPRPAR
jgi:uncharacterized tellurite resistance protein B-like protein